MSSIVTSGIDTFLQKENQYRKFRMALVTNDAAATCQGQLSRKALMKKGFKLIRLFSPEHGISKKGIDGAYQQDITDTITRLPVISLYGDKMVPGEDDLSDIDLVLFDIPDVGCRFYTYLWTMTYIMEACSVLNKPLIILDRPNPIGGDLNKAEGPMLDEASCSSFIGRWSIPIRHCCTLGELALYFASEKFNGADVTVIRANNWQRTKLADNSNFRFIPTSPAIKNLSTALLYPGIGLLEGVNINEGRGTEKPFRKFGAPWINAQNLHQHFLEKKTSGIKSKPVSYIPTDSLYKGEKCHGLELEITEDAALSPVAAGISIMEILFSRYPEKIKERLYKTHANPSGENHLDKLIGIKDSFEKLHDRKSFETNVNPGWEQTISPFLLYS